MTGPIEEAAPGAVTVAEWPEELAGVLTGAADQARAAVAEFSGAEAVGDYLGVSYEDPNAATHRFLAHVPGYQGWQWAVVVAGYAGAHRATISEVVLIPGPTALLAPEWVPWEQRVRPGDLSPGDLLAPVENDPRLVPGYGASGDPQVDEVAAEVGFGRRWVLSAWGRAEAAERWHEGDYGPNSAMSRSTKRVCRDCGFFLPLAGSLGAMFGVCGNALSADGHVVDKQYGCGAHSDTPAPAGTGSPMYEPFDDGVLEVIPDIPGNVAEQASEVVVEVAEQVSEEPAEELAAEPTEETAALEPAEEPAAEVAEVAEEPVVETEAAPAAEPEQPTAAEPAQPTAAEPEQPTAAEPAQPTAEAPEEPPAEAPAEPS